MAEEKGLSYVIPAFNEEGSIVETVDRLREALKTLPIPFEILVVDDGSTDGTSQALGTLRDVTVLRHPVNTGYGSAIKTGILRARYSWIGIVDADCTYDIATLPKLVQGLEDGFDLVIAERSRIAEIDRPIKRYCRKALILAIGFLTAAKIRDPNSGFRVFSKDLAMTFFPFLCNTFSFTTSLTIFAHGEAYFVKYVPTEYFRRKGKTKVRHVRDSMRIIQLILQGVTFFNPVKFFLILVLVLVLFVGLPAVVMGALGWQWISGAYLIIGNVAVFLVGLGVLADIFRISSTTRITKKPHVIERFDATGLESRGDGTGTGNA